MTTQHTPDPPNDDQAMLVTWLAIHDAPCPACKYNLRHLTQPRCPECGRPLSLSVAIVEPNQPYWIATTVLLVGNGAVGALIALMEIWNLTHQGSLYLPPELFFRFLMLFSVSSAPLAVVCLFFRRFFVRLSPLMQRSLLGAVAFMTFIGFATILFFVLG